MIAAALVGGAAGWAFLMFPCPILPAVLPPSCVSGLNVVLFDFDPHAPSIAFAHGMLFSSACGAVLLSSLTFNQNLDENCLTVNISCKLFER